MNGPIPRYERDSRDKFRASLRATCITQGFPLDHLDETLDVAMHAVDEAMDTVARICTSSPDMRVQLAAIPLALQLLAQLAEDKANHIIEISKASGNCQTFEAVINPRP